MGRWDKVDSDFTKGNARIEVRKEKYQAGKKNQGGAAYDIVSLDYEKSKNGDKLRGVDEGAKVRALIRSKNLDGKNNGGFNILTGEQRMAVLVPAHDKYNPVRNAGQ